jgi:cytochrome o ubiquinol oxidase subunit 1
MWWLAIVGIVGVIATVIARSFARNVDKVIVAATVAQIEQRWRQGLADATPIRRELEMTFTNQGLAEVAR